MAKRYARRRGNETKKRPPRSAAESAPAQELSLEEILEEYRSQMAAEEETAPPAAENLTLREDEGIYTAQVTQPEAEPESGEPAPEAGLSMKRRSFPRLPWSRRRRAAPGRPPPRNWWRAMTTTPIFTRRRAPDRGGRGGGFLRFPGTARRGAGGGKARPPAEKQPHRRAPEGGRRAVGQICGLSGPGLSAPGTARVPARPGAGGCPGGNGAPQGRPTLRLPDAVAAAAGPGGGGGLPAADVDHPLLRLSAGPCPAT